MHCSKQIHLLSWKQIHKETVLGTSNNENFKRNDQFLQYKNKNNQTALKGQSHHLKILRENVLMSSDMVSAIVAAVNPRRRDVRHRSTLTLLFPEWKISSQPN